MVNKHLLYSTTFVVDVPFAKTHKAANQIQLFEPLDPPVFRPLFWTIEVICRRARSNDKAFETRLKDLAEPSRADL